ncbi:immunoglobulin domain-containing protein [Algibacter sp. 2305UL17-15]|uniref:immunoglobulin domain-containing protein n=1 Tax=Algibacter sp. 2305UL17-15 TaxID=3231268 RepID=UPI003459621D
MKRLLLLFSIALISSYNLFSQVPQTEHDALVAFYNATNGTDWTNNTNWNTANPVSTWHGIGITIVDGVDHVTSIALHNNNVSGFIPSEIDDLPYLSHLILGFNNIGDNIPEEIGNLSNLIVLGLDFNNLTGTIPAELMGLSKLESLNLGRNPLSGGIPPEIGNLLNLSYLALGGSSNGIKLGGTIPTELGNLINLQRLDLRLCGLTGSIPPELGNLTKLNYLYLLSNNLTGNIPDELGNLSNLYGLALSHNQLTGPIPISLTTIPNLTNLNLGANRLTGGIPKEIGDLTSLTNLSISGTPNGEKIGGTIPPELGNLTNLSFLDLRSSDLNGSIPDELGTLTNLNYLYLFSNNLSGSVPSNFSNLINLINLDISDNNLSNDIPDLTSANNLAYFHFQDNNFQFGDFEDEFISYQSQINDFVHTPQKAVSLTIEDKILDIGDDISLSSLPISGANNLYQWHFNGQPIDLNTNPNISGATSETLQISNITANQTGTYQCIVTNSIITDLSFIGSTFQVELLPASHPDYNALIALYNALNGDTWTNNTNWLDTSKPISSWHGITETNGRVTGIDLSSNNLSGDIPTSIDGLSQLENLNFRSNSLTGFIPAEIGNLSYLSFIDLAINSLSGEIPQQIGNLQALTWLDLAHNDLSGAVPNELTTIPNLTRLGLAYNSFMGTLPDFTNQNLFVLAIDGNYFQFGDFESEFTSYQNNIAQFLYAPQQNLDENHSVEQTLNVGDNITLTSSPVSGTNTYYQWFFGSNAISGANSTSLELENIQLNEMGVYTCYAFNSLISGLTPRTGIATLNRVPSLHPEYDALVAFYNATDGDNWTNNTNWLTDAPINSWYGVGTLYGDGNSLVTALYLNNNNLTGVIPDEIGDFSNLFNLELGGNNLTGSIPQSITNLTQLGGLALYHNQLTGDVPDISANTNLNYVYIYNNDFQFDDLENSFTNYQNKLGVGYVYSPQNAISSTVTTKLITIGDNVDFTSESISGENNIYQWYFNGNPVDINSNPNATDPTQPNFQISNITGNQLGIYECIVFNSLVFNLSYVVGTYEVGAPPAQSPDYDALVAFYNSTGGNNWKNNTNWLDTTKPIYTWHGITETNGRVTGISLFGNNLVGPLPSNIGDLSALESLHLPVNKISGQIPSSFSNLSNLKSLSFALNDITGNIPEDIGNLSQLTSLFLNANYLNGNIPSSIWNLSKLQYLFLPQRGGNKLSLIDNKIPSNVVLQDLTSLSLSNIPIAEPIPSEFLDVPNLRRIDINQCRIPGALPKEFANISQVFAEFNDFEGTIPQELINAVGNDNLNIANNYFDFNDLEPLVMANNYNTLNYSPQRTKDIEQNLDFPPGGDITLSIDDTRHNKFKNSKGVGDVYQWFKDNVAISGANSSTYIIANALEADSGVYYCQITNNLVPDLVITRANITLVIDANLTVDETDKNSFSIYPNPTNNIINIKLGNYQEAQATLFDTNGRKILEQKLTTENTIMDIGNLNSGMYVFHIKTKDDMVVKRIIKQ